MPKVKGFQDEELTGLSKEEIEALGGDVEGDEDEPTPDELAEAEAEKVTNEKAEADKAKTEAEKAEKKDGEEGEKPPEEPPEPEKKSEKEEKAEEKEPPEEPPTEKTDVEKEAAEKQIQEALAATDDKDALLESVSFPAPAPPPLIPDEKIDELKKKVEDAKEKFDLGEITYEEFSDARRELDRAQDRNELIRETFNSQRESYWQFEQSRFFAAYSDYSTNRALNGAFVSEVNRLIADPENNSFTDMQLLIKAKRNVESELGILKPKKEETPPDPKAEAEKNEQARKKALESGADRTKLPPNLGDLPVAETDTGAGKWDYLDKLEGAAYEKAVAKLSPAEREEYEAAH